MLPPDIKSLDPWQVEILTSTNRENHVLVHRQGGKSQIIAAKACLIALTEPGSLILNVSPSWKQSLELARTIRACLRRYRDVLQRQHEELDYVDLGLLTDTRNEFELSNHSRIVSLTSNEETIRGYSKPRLIILDEASRIPDDVYLCLRPMLLVSPNWELWIISTPFGQRGFFHMESRNPTFKKYRQTIWDSLKLGRVNRKFIEDEKKKGDIYFQQEFECEFVSNLQTLFTRKELEDHRVTQPPLQALYDCLRS